MTKSGRTAIAAVPLLLVGVGGGSGTFAALVENGSFEADEAPVGFYTLVPPGTVTGWDFIGPPGSNVAIIGENFSQGGFTFPAQEGVQFIDLTGTSNTTSGLQTMISTQPGTAYDVAFFLGNVVDPTGAFGATSTVGLQIDGGAAVSFTNLGGAGSNMLFWEQKSHQFVATGSSTMLAFINMDPSSDSANSLDNIAVTVVPEASQWAMMLGGLGLIALAVRRRRSPPA